MGTKEEMKIKCRVFKDEDIRKEGNIWYIPGQDGSVKVVKVEPMKTKEDVITELLKRVSDLEFEVEKLEKNVQYKYINGQAYFRQDYVLGREKEIDRLHSIIKEVREFVEKRKNTQIYFKGTFKDDGIDRQFLIEQYDDILEILDKENIKSERST